MQVATEQVTLHMHLLFILMCIRSCVDLLLPFLYDDLSVLPE